MQLGLRDVKKAKGVVVGLVLAGCLATGVLLAGLNTYHGAGEQTLVEGSTQTIVGGREFWVHTNARTYDAARSYCASVDMVLAAIDSSTLIAALNPLSMETWMGLYRRGAPAADLKEGWLFEDASHNYDSATLPWASGYPQTGAGRNCAYYFEFESYGYPLGVYDSVCTSLLAFVCEKKAAATTAPTPSENSVTLLYRDTFVAARASGYSFDGASRFCARFGSHLAVIQSAAENVAVATALEDLGVDNAWVGLSHADGSWKFVDGGAMTWNPFASGQQTGASALSRAFIDTLDSGLWHKAEASDKTLDGFVCEGFGFALVVGSKNWTDANHYCADYYGTFLATVRDTDSNNDMAAALSPFGTQAWVGLKTQAASDWLWVDDSPTHYLHWAAAEPSSQPLPNCAATAGDGEWHSHECAQSAEVGAFFCAVPATRTAVVAPFIVVGLELDWQNAQQFCVDTYGTQLAFIDNSAQNELVRQGVAAMQLTSAWIGLKQSVAQTFVWADNSQPTFHQWAAGNPLSEAHAQISPELGDWYNVAGTIVQAGFVCMAPA